MKQSTFNHLWETWGGLSKSLFNNMDIFDRLIKEREADSVGIFAHRSGINVLFSQESGLYHELKESLVTDSIQHYLGKGIKNHSDLEKHNRLVCIASRITGIKRPDLRPLHLEQLSELVNNHKNKAA